MRISTILNNSLVTFFMYLSILLFMSFFIRDINNQFYSYNTIEEIIKTSDLGDPVSFLTGAIDISKNRWFTPANQWLINLWPPAFMLLEGYIIKLFGETVYIVLILQIIISLFFSIILSLLYGLLSKNINNIFAFIIPLIIFIFPVSRVFLLEPTGILLGESFSIAFFFLFFLFTLKAHYDKSIFYALLSGFFLGISAYFRSQFETILIMISLFATFFILFYFIKYRVFLKNKDFDLKFLNILFYVVLMSNITTLPWRIYNYVNNDRLSWVATSSLTYTNLVRTSETLKNAGGGWIVDGKGNMICLMNPLACDDIPKSNFKLLLTTFLKDPISWYKLKFEPINNYWFSELGYWTSPSSNNTYTNLVINYVIIVMIFFIFLTLYLKRKLAITKIITWITSSVISTYLIIFTVIHFEARYFYFPKIFIIFTFILSLNLYFKKDDCGK